MSKYILVTTPNGEVQVLKRKVLRGSYARRSPRQNAEALARRRERESRDTNFFGSTAKSKWERRVNAMKVAVRGLASDKVLDWCACHPAPLAQNSTRRLTGEMSYDTTPLESLDAEHVDKLSAWIGKGVVQN